MKVLFDMVDTPHVHFFKQLIWLLQDHGHEVLVTAREKDVTINLLKTYKINYICISKKGNGILGLAWELFTRNLRLINVVRKFKPDVMLAKNGGASIGPVGFLMRVPRIVLEDTEHAKLQRMIGLPFMTKIITGTGYIHDHGKRQCRFNGVWPQSYLAPEFFTPDPDKLRQHGIDPDQPYIVLRTVAWEAAHDVGHKGIDVKTLTEVVNTLSKFGRVIICSEKPLPEELSQYQNPVPVEYVHHLLAFAKLYIGEGASMAAEAAILSTPAIYCNPLPLGYIKAMADDYQLISIAENFQHALIIAKEQLTNNDFQTRYEQRAKEFIQQTDDLTYFMLKTIKQTVKNKQKRKK